MIAFRSQKEKKSDITRIYEYIYRIKYNHKEPTVQCNIDVMYPRRLFYVVQIFIHTC